ncbi:MAG: hypothetical protein WA191_14440 [Telluria sp.]
MKNAYTPAKLMIFSKLGHELGEMTGRVVSASAIKEADKILVELHKACLSQPSPDQAALLVLMRFIEAFHEALDKRVAVDKAGLH